MYTEFLFENSDGQKPFVSYIPRRDNNIKIDLKAVRWENVI
jgi:hypothetical protein